MRRNDSDPVFSPPNDPRHGSVGNKAAGDEFAMPIEPFVYRLAATKIEPGENLPMSSAAITGGHHKLVNPPRLVSLVRNVGHSTTHVRLRQPAGRTASKQRPKPRARSGSVQEGSGTGDQELKRQIRRARRKERNAAMRYDTLVHR